MAYIELSRDNFFHNLKVISSRIGGVDKLFVVLKDNAYGHGLKEMAKLSKEFGAKRAAVKSVKEAIKIREFFEYILILSDIPKEVLPFAGVVINDINKIKTIPKSSNVELKVDTGMHRNGININDIEKSIKLIKQRGLKLKGVMSHFRSADEFSSEFFWQRENFKEVKKEVRRICHSLELPLPYFHSHNSAAILRANEFDDDFARSGISIYGYHYIPKPLPQPNLKPVLSLWAEKLSQRELKKGQRIGYGGVFEADRNMIVSTYDVGYGDGFFRYDGLGELKTSSGKKILGRVSMDSMALEGDDEKVCIINDATPFAKHFNTITYEIITNLSPHIKRLIL